MGRVIIVGSVNVDLVVSAERLPRAGETVAGGTFARHGGGKGANQAVAAARRGAEVAMVAAVGDDDFGAAAGAELAGEGVDVTHVARLDDVATGVALIVVDTAGENQIAVASGANGALAGEHVRRALEALSPAAGDVVLISFEVGDEAVEAAVGGAGGATLVLDPAPARALPDARVIVTPNAAEARELTGEDDPAAAARSLHTRTRAPVVLTLGAEGALVLDGDGDHRLPAPEAEVVDSTGAGDALAGALAAALAGGTPLLDAARAAVEVASAAVGRAGAR